LSLDCFSSFFNPPLLYYDFAWWIFLRRVPVRSFNNEHRVATTLTEDKTISSRGIEDDSRSTGISKSNLRTNTKKSAKMTINWVMPVRGVQATLSAVVLGLMAYGTLSQDG